MDAEVTISEPEICSDCGKKIRARYVNREFYDTVEVDPIDDKPNPIHLVHQCNVTTMNGYTWFGPYTSDESK